VESNHDNPWWLAVYVLAINFGLALLRFIWVWVSLQISYRVAQRRGDTQRTRPHWRLVAAMSVAGVRGAITLAGVLTLPLVLSDGSEFPARDLAIFLAAGVIILSLTAASFLLPPLLRGLQLPAEKGEEDEIDFARGEAAKAAIRAIEKSAHDMASGQIDADLYAEAAARVMEIYRRRLEGHLPGENSVRIRQMDEIERQLRLAAIAAERETFFALARSNRISDAKSRALVREIDLLEERFGRAGAHH